MPTNDLQQAIDELLDATGLGRVGQRLFLRDGKLSLPAALHPAPGEALFFVARGDGGHVFSETLAEHEAAVRQYQLQRRQDYRSSPEQP